MKQAQLLSDIFDKKTVLILQNLMKKKDDFYLRELSKEAGVSLATTYRIVSKLAELGLVHREKKAKTTEYSINRESELYTQVYNLIVGEKPDARKLLKKFVSEQLPEIKLYGVKNNKKKVFFVGTKPDVNIIKMMLEEVYNQTEIKLDVLTVDEEQFKGMQDMGLLKDLITI